ncbi:hypothetical protein AMTR_s00103p00139970 [Amborella trichopoda]|uniref:Uncharacterized protein n=1 Tax=Amborella trichopoda TaxID=13333 RepID=W1NZZ5_AMBTC|nr:hypothetical protein AMTR_s00103p00139970 [Amborella trichopoda]
MGLLTARVLIFILRFRSHVVEVGQPQYNPVMYSITDQAGLMPCGFPDQEYFKTYLYAANVDFLLHGIQISSKLICKRGSKEAFTLHYMIFGVCSCVKAQFVLY